MFLNKKISSSLIKLSGKFTPLGYVCKEKFETTPIFNRFITYFWNNQLDLHYWFSRKFSNDLQQSMVTKNLQYTGIDRI